MLHKSFLTTLLASAVSLTFFLAPFCGSARAEPGLWSELSGSASANPGKAQTLPDFIALAAKLSPAVVSISAEQGGSKTRSEPEGESEPFPFRHFGGEPHERGLGSGFIINKDGYILTNEHVVEAANEVLVTTRDGNEYRASVLGTDPKTDVALLKINAGHDLSVAPLGNSDDVKVGQWVMAIGNPFGFGHSVTAGIVSAKGRFIPGAYDEFIQTDASINPGNSGGPLIDLKGEVVAVNSAIYTHNGFNIGIGFSIPINLVKEELPQLKANGKVVRGWLGIQVQRVTPDIAHAMGLTQAQGALVAKVMDGTPAKAAGMKPGDVIIAYEGHAVGDYRELSLLVGHTAVGHKATVKLIRGAAVKELPVTIAVSHEEELASAEPASSGSSPGHGPGASLGLTMRDLSPELAHEFGLGQQNGVLISSVSDGSPADKAGLQRGDLIIEVNRREVKDLASCNRALASRVKGKPVLLLVKRHDVTVFVAVKTAG